MNLTVLIRKTNIARLPVSWWTEVLTPKPTWFNSKNFFYRLGWMFARLNNVKDLQANCSKFKNQLQAALWSEPNPNKLLSTRLSINTATMSLVRLSTSMETFWKFRMKNQIHRRPILPGLLPHRMVVVCVHESSMVECTKLHIVWKPCIRPFRRTMRKKNRWPPNMPTKTPTHGFRSRKLFLFSFTHTVQWISLNIKSI